MIRRILYIGLILVLACREEENLPGPYEILTSHIWISESYTLEGISYEQLEIKLVYRDTLKAELPIYPGDTLRFNQIHELLFTDGLVMKETFRYDGSLRCSTCPSYEPMVLNPDSRQRRYIADNEYIMLSNTAVTVDPADKNAFKVDFLSNKKIKIYKWAIVKDESEKLYDLIVNGLKIEEGREYPLDIVFYGNL